MIDVKEFGAAGDGQTDDAGAIKSALLAAAATGEEVFFPAGDYALHTSVADAVVEVDLGDTPLRLRGEPGARLRAFSATGQRAESLFKLGKARAGLTVRGLHFSGEALVSQLATIENDGQTPRPGDVLVDDCRFEQAYQVDQAYFAAGIYVRGAFDTVRVHGCRFQRIRTNKTGKHASRGVTISAEGDVTVIRPRTAIVTDCVFEAISSADGIDADGIHVQLLRAITNAAGTKVSVPHPMSSALIQGCRFIDCQFRSVKLQLERSQVLGNSFLRRSFDGNYEVDAQYSGLVASGNLFHYIDHRCIFSVINSTIRQPGQSHAVFTDNLFTFENITSSRVVSSTVDHDTIEAGADHQRVVIANNVVHGTIARFLWLRGVPPAGAAVTLTNNVVDDCTEFIFADNPEATGPAVLAGDYAFNRVVAGPRPRALLHDGVVFQPDNWQGNTNIV